MSRLSTTLIITELEFLKADKIISRARIVRHMTELKEQGKFGQADFLKPELKQHNESIEALQMSIDMWKDV